MMVLMREENKEESVEFCWGSKKGVGGSNKDVQFYESFSYDGVEYFLDDCVYLWSHDDPEPNIGKLVKIWETPSQKKKVKVVWFFRPIEIQNWLGDVKPLKNEIFLASGEGIGVFDLNPLEAVSGKCTVICTSKDKRNLQASGEELRRADYIFDRIFDVVSREISDKFPDEIAGHAVEHFFNQRKHHKITDRRAVKVNFKEEAGLSKLSLKALAVEDGDSGRSTKLLEKRESKIVAVNTTLRPKTFVGKDEIGTLETSSSQLERAKVKYSGESVSDFQPLKKRKLQITTVDYKDDHVPRLPVHNGRLLDDNGNVHEEKRPPPIQGNSDQKANKIPDKEMGQFDKGGKIEGQILEVTRRPDVDTSKWFKQQAWDERMQRAHENGSLVLLENLDPSYTSSEVEDIIWHALETRVSAKMIQRSTFSSPHCGQAYVIFRSKGAAELALSELYKKCLVLSGGRPVVARRKTLKEPSNPSKFPGHLVIDRLRFQRQREEMRNAVSTSHCSQPNTIEYDMAIEWRVLQQKTRMWWDALNKQQAKEIEDLRIRLKTQLNG
ncbi:hypothetical protein LguiA_028601 [Lonicera macranthoides]